MKQATTKKEKRHDWNYLIRVIAYALFAGCNGLETMAIGYLTYYMTNSLFLSVGAAGLIVALAKVFDGFSDVIAGVIIDCSHSKLGKGRPFTLFGILTWGALVLLFSTPQQLPVGAKYAYVFIMYLLTDTVFRTLYATADPVHYRRGFNPAEGMDSASIWGLVGGLISIAGGIILPALVKIYEHQAHGWTVIMTILAIPSAVMFLLKFLLIPEKYDLEEPDAQQEKVKFGDAFRVLLRNKYLLLVGICLLLVTVIMSMSSAQTYYFTYIVGDLGQMSLANTFSMLSLVVMPFYPLIAKKVGKRRMTVWAFAIGTVISLVPIFCDKNVMVLGAVYAIRMCCYSALNMAPVWFTIDCMKYTEWKEGTRNDALCGAVISVAQKIGGALAMLITGLVLQVAGFNGSLAVQPQSATGAIWFMYILFPAVIMAVCGLLMSRYKVEDLMPQIEQDLAARANKQ